MPKGHNENMAWRAWRAVSEADIDTLREIWSEKILWHATGKNPWAGSYEGPNAVLDYLARVGESVDIFDASLDDVLTSDDRIALVFHVHTERGNRRLDLSYSLLARLENGEVAEVWTTPLNPEALEQFWHDA
jgi:ketosteroid isomerase-like protein